MKEMQIVSVETYRYLLEPHKSHGYLEAAGVDNWDGYDVAKELMHEDESEGE